MRLVYIEPVDAQLLKGDDIILSLICHELVQPGLQGLLRFLHLFDGEVLAPAVFDLPDRLLDLFDLPVQHAFLSFCGDRDLLELGVAYYDGIVIAGGYPGTELLAVRCLEVLAGCDEDVGAGVEAEEFICPLERQMVGHDEHAFLAEPEALALHGRGSHLEGLAGFIPISE